MLRECMTPALKIFLVLAMDFDYFSRQILTEKNKYDYGFVEIIFNYTDICHVDICVHKLQPIDVGQNTSTGVTTAHLFVVVNFST